MNLSNCFKKHLVWLLLIIVLAFLLRILYLENFSPAFHHDEALNGYEAYSIFKTGRDHRGNSLPIFFEGFSDKVDNRLPLYIYLTIPSVALLGLNEFSTRLTAAIFGTLTVLIIYFLAKKLFKKEEVALLSSFFLAISPWHILLSRTAMEPVFVAFFFPLAFLFLIKGIDENKKNLIVSAVFFSLLLYTHHSVKVFLPIFLIIALFILRKRWKEFKVELLISFFIFLIFLTPYFLNPARLSSGRLPESMFIFFVFPFWQWPIILIYDLLTYPFISPLFFSYFTTFFFATYGVFLVAKQRENKNNQLLLSAIAVSFLPGVLFFQNPHFLRTAAVAPFLEIFSALGFWWFFQKIKKRILLFSFLVVFFLFIVLNILLIRYNATYIPYVIFQKKYKEIIGYIKETEKNYERVVFGNIGNQTYIYLLFYSSYPPEKFQNSKVERIYLPNGWQMVTSFDKYEFCDINQCYSPDKNNLYVVKGGELTYLKAKKIFYNLDGSVFRVITNEK